MTVLEEARAKTREGIEDVQLRLELHRLHGDLGHEVFRLYELHELDHPTVAAYAELIARVEERLAALRAEC